MFSPPHPRVPLRHAVVDAASGGIVLFPPQAAPSWWQEREEWDGFSQQNAETKTKVMINETKTDKSLLKLAHETLSKVPDKEWTVNTYSVHSYEKGWRHCAMGHLANKLSDWPDASCIRCSPLGLRINHILLMLGFPSLQEVNDLTGFYVETYYNLLTPKTRVLALLEDAIRKCTT